MHIIIPMSGLGQRFINAGYKDPKPLILIEDIPLIEHVCNFFLAFISSHLSVILCTCHRQICAQY